MRPKLALRWAIAAALIAGWVWWPSEPRAERATGWQLQTDLPMLVTGPRGLVVGRNGDVYVPEADYVQILPSGGFHPERLPVPGLKSPFGVASGPAGELYIGEYTTRRVLKISADRKTITPLVLPDSTGTEGSLEIGVAVDHSGTLFVTDVDRSRVLKLPAGAGSFEVVAAVEHLRPAIAVSDDGDLVVVVSIPDPGPGTSLLTFRGGKAPAVSTPLPGLQFVDAITIDHRGNRVFADNALEFHSENGELTSTRTATLWRLGAQAATPQRLPYTDLGEIEGLTVDAADTIFYTDSEPSRVVRLSPAG
ncbi:hypothetical protein ACFYO1_16770 [Nocardia sp. NPDC006044]|uniref:hypothetical protein n=1 Tax=Nocardia sp. NPDC006044 TaxID=3364306 RepID=UPI00368E098D